MRKLSISLAVAAGLVLPVLAGEYKIKTGSDLHMTSMRAGIVEFYDEDGSHRSRFKEKSTFAPKEFLEVRARCDNKGSTTETVHVEWSVSHGDKNASLGKSATVALKGDEYTEFGKSFMPGNIGIQKGEVTIEAKLIDGEGYEVGSRALTITVGESN